MKLTIQQAMTRRGNIEAEINNIFEAIYRAYGVVSLDGNDVVSEVTAKQFEDNVNRLNELAEENAVLADKIQEANINTLLDGKSVTYWLNYLKKKRNLIRMLNRDRTSGVVSGVGFVENDYVVRDIAVRERELEEYCNGISERIDQLNSEVTIEI